VPAFALQMPVFRSEVAARAMRARHRNGACAIFIPLRNTQWCSNGFT
jgi:hypothetical protein